MKAPVYKKIEIVGTSGESVEDAIQNAVTQASKTLRNVDWFEVVQIRGRIVENNVIDSYQVDTRIGFRLDNED